MTKNRVAAPSRQKRRLPSKFNQTATDENDPTIKNSKDSRNSKDFGKGKHDTKKKPVRVNEKSVGV